MTAEPTFFFVHVMKTGGTTFVQHLEANFPPDAVYPGPARGADRQRAYMLVDDLRALDEEQRRRIRAYAGHFPFAASELVGADVTMTILREPVARTVSYLRDCKRHRPQMADLPLEAIYEDAWINPLYLRDYQVKQFAMTAADRLESHLDVVEVDDARLAVAVEHLERVDVVGLNHRFGDFLDEVRTRFGWRIGPAPDLRVSTEGWDVPDSFRRRIAEENAADVAFWEHACRLVERRRRADRTVTR